MRGCLMRWLLFVSLWAAPVCAAPEAEDPLEGRIERLGDEIEAIHRLCSDKGFQAAADKAAALLPQAVELARAHPGNKRAQELEAKIRGAVERDGFSWFNDIPEEGIDALRSAGLEAVAWLEKSQLRAAVANFGEKRTVRVALAFWTGSPDGTRSYPEVAGADVTLEPGRVGLVRFQGIPKPPPKPKEGWVDDRPVCRVTADTPRGRASALVLIQGWMEHACRWDCSGYVVKGDDTVQIAFHLSPRMTVFVPKRIVSRAGNTVAAQPREKDSVREAAHGWFFKDADGTLDLQVKGIRGLDRIEIPEVLTRRIVGGCVHIGDGISNDRSPGPRLIVLPPDVDAAKQDVPLPEANRQDAVPLDGDPSKRARQLAARLESPVWNVAREAAQDLLALGEAAKPVLVELKMKDHVLGSVTEVLGDAIAKANPDQVPADLLARLADRDWSRGFDAARAVARLGDMAVEPLLKALREGDTRARCAAIVGLSHVAAPKQPERIRDVFLESLKDAESHVRLRAVEALGTLRRPETIPALAKILAADPDEHVRIWAAIALGEIGDRAAVPALIEVLGKTETPRDLRSTLLGILGNLKDPAVVPVCLPYLFSEDKELRSRAVQALRGCADARAADALIAVLHEKKEEIYSCRVQAVRALGHAGAKAAVDPLIDLLCNPSCSEDHPSICASLRELGVPVKSIQRGEHWQYLLPEPPRALVDQAARKTVADLVADLGNDDWQVRRCAAQQLAARPPAEVAPALVPLATHADPARRRQAVVLLGRIGHAPSLAPLGRLLADPAAQVRRAAADALVGARLAELKDDWLGASASSDWYVRAKTAEALGRLGSAEDTPRLRQALKDPDVNARCQAIRALGRLRDAAAAPLMAQILTGRHGKNEEDAVREALIAIGEPAVPSVLSVFNSAFGGIRDLARDVLVAIGPAARPALLQALRDKRLKVDEEAMIALARLGGEGTAEQLFEWMTDRNRHGCEAALEAMGAAAGPALKVYAQKGTPRQRMAAAALLAKLGDRSAVSSLIGMLKDQDPEIRADAGGKLVDMGTPDDIPALLEAAVEPDCPQNVFWAIRKIKDARAVPVMESLLFSRSGWEAATTLFELTGKPCRYLDHDGLLTTWNQTAADPPTGVEAGVVGGKSRQTFDFEDGSGGGWKGGRVVKNPARGTHAIEIPPSDNEVRLASPDLSHRITPESWFSLRYRAPERVQFGIVVRTNPGETFSAFVTVMKEGWQGFCCPLAGLRASGRSGPASSKIGDTVIRIELRIYRARDRQVPLYLDDLILTGGAAGRPGGPK